MNYAKWVPHLRTQPTERSDKEENRDYSKTPSNWLQSPCKSLLERVVGDCGEILRKENPETVRTRKMAGKKENQMKLTESMHAKPSLYEYPASLCLQLRVIRAFKSTLEDLEERRSVHSLHSLHSLRSSRSHTGPWPPRPLSDITYIDEDPTSVNKLSPQQIKNDRERVQDEHRLLSPNTLRPPSSHHNNPQNAQQQQQQHNNSSSNNTELLPNPVHETRI